MGLFKDKGKSKNESVATSAPEEDETPEEIKHIKELGEGEEIKKEIEYREVPVCLSRTQIDNMILENNIMLKQIISEMDS